MKKVSEVRAAITDKSGAEAMEMVREMGFEILYSEDGMFEYSNGSHVFEVDYDEEGVYDCSRVCSVGEYYEEEE